MSCSYTGRQASMHQYILTVFSTVLIAANIANTYSMVFLCVTVYGKWYG